MNYKKNKIFIAKIIDRILNKDSNNPIIVKSLGIFPISYIVL